MNNIVKLTTSERGEANPILLAKKQMIMKGLHQLSISWLSTYYRVKKSKEGEHIVYLDKSINGKRFAILRHKDLVSGKGPSRELVFDCMSELKAFLGNTTLISGSEDYDIINVR